MKNLIKLAIKSIRYRKSVLSLSVLSVALSVILLLGVERIRGNIRESFSSTLSGTDLIVGARSGNIPLLLSTIFHMGYPNQNVSWETYEKIRSQERVAWSIPLSLGDSHRSFDVVATNAAFFDHFRYGRDQPLQATEGDPLVEGKSCVLGSKVARELGYQTGQEIVITHGMGEKGFIQHEKEPFRVAAILKATGTPVDQRIFVSLYALDEIHAGFYGGYSRDHDVFADVVNQPLSGNHAQGQEREPESISGFLLGLKSPNDILAMQRMLNEYRGEPLTAIMPVVTMMELWEVVRPVEQGLMVISALVLAVALAGMLTTMMTGLNERRREMAILRSVGANPRHIFGLIMLETSGIMLTGIVAGLCMLQLILYLAKPLIAAKLGLVMPVGWISEGEFALLSAIFVLGSLIGLLPAYRSYKTSMSDGLMVNK